MKLYANREDAGRHLAAVLMPHARSDVVVLALPRGGVVIGAVVARMLHAPLGIIQVRKISHPAAPEYAIGAVAENDQPLYDEFEAAQVDAEWLKEAEEHARAVMRRRRKLYFDHDFAPPQITGKTVIVVDDGIATGLTFEAAVHTVRHQNPRQIIAAVPVASAESVARLRHVVDELIVLDDPDTFMDAVGIHYQKFDEVHDEEVGRLLREVNHDISKQTPRRTDAPSSGAHRPIPDNDRAHHPLGAGAWLGNVNY